MNEEGHVQYCWVEGTNNTADIFTKALGQFLFEKFVDPLCGYAISPVEILAPPMLGRPEAATCSWSYAAHWINQRATDLHGSSFERP
jgi:hypothetical protein